MVREIIVKMLTGLEWTIVLCAIVALVRDFYYKHVKPNNDKVMNEQEHDSIPEVERDNIPETVDPKTKQLLVDTLEKLKLEAKVDEDFKEFVMTDFQGEHFRIKIENKKFIEVQDLHWYEAPLDNLDNLLIIHKAMNWINMTTSCRMVYTIDDDENKVNLHTQTTLLWIPEIPEIVENRGRKAFKRLFCLLCRDYFVILQAE